MDIFRNMYLDKFRLSRPNRDSIPSILGIFEDNSNCIRFGCPNCIIESKEVSSSEYLVYKVSL